MQKEVELVIEMERENCFLYMKMESNYVFL